MLHQQHTSGREAIVLPPQEDGFRQIETVMEEVEFYLLLTAQYDQLGFPHGINLRPDQIHDAVLTGAIRHLADSGSFMPGPDTKLYGLWEQGVLNAICSANEVAHPEVSHFDCVPQTDETNVGPLYELNTVVVNKTARGGHSLTELVGQAVLHLSQLGATCVCGLVRYEVLSHFVRLGAMPIVQAPLKLLASHEYEDFIIYFDVGSPDATHYLQQHLAMTKERERRLHDIRVHRIARRRHKIH